MGVPKFYRWISERYPCLSEVVKEYQLPEFDNLYLDMNGIIHVCSHPEDDNPHFRITEEQIFRDICHYIEFLFRMIKPRKVFFMAIDGVAPRAKMNQQRGRRFRSAREAEELIKRAQEKGEVLPTEKRFDSNCITPGTVFMKRLQDHLKYFVVSKVTQDPLWQGPKIILSGHETPGEGEHKVMDFIRYSRSQPGHDPNTRHCLYGLDADLIMLGLTSHEPHFALLREEVRFGGRKDKNKRPATPEDTTFHLLHLSLLREYLDYEFSSLKTKLPFGYNLENIIDDWILMGFLVGNDFVPHLPHLHIHHDALPLLWKTYINVLPTLDGFLNEGGHLNLHRFEKFVGCLAEFDRSQFNEQFVDMKYLEGKRSDAAHDKGAPTSGKEQNGPDRKQKKRDGGENAFAALEGLVDMDLEYNENGEENGHLEAHLASGGICDSDIDSDDDFDTFDAEFSAHKRDYYMTKLEYENVTPEVLRDQAYEYVRAIQWILLYYYEGVQSWSWFYPHHYAPYISDVRDFRDMTIAFEMSEPFKPFEQLMAVLPAASKELLPIPFQELMTCESSPVRDYYPVQFRTDLNGKQQDWEAVVLIPFIDEKRLLEAMRSKESSLTAEERHRNSHGPCYMYQFSPEQQGTYPSSMPGVFPDVAASHAKICDIPKFQFCLEPHRIVKGLMKGTKLDVYFPGFPTLKHIPHEHRLEKCGVKVFQMNSRGYNMMLTIKDIPEKSLEEVATDLLGQTVWIGWPHFHEAKVYGVTDEKFRITVQEVRKKDQTSHPVQWKKEKVNGPELDILYKEASTIRENYYTRFGVEVGKTTILIYAGTMTGRRYVHTSKGKITAEKQFSLRRAPFALQTTCKDILIEASDDMHFRTTDELFPPGATVFMLGNPHYGCQGEVLEVDNKDGRIRVSFKVLQEPDLSHVLRNEVFEQQQYVPSYIAAQQLGLSNNLLARITGTVLILRRDGGNTEAKANIGLNLKFTKRGEEVPGYTKKTEDGWLYSQACLDAINQYLTEFAELWDYIASSQTGNSDIYTEAELFPEFSQKKLKDVLQYLEKLPCSQIRSVKIGGDIVGDATVLAIERIIDDIVAENKKRQRKVKMQVRPHLLFRPLPNQGSLEPDPGTTFELLDRVVAVKVGYSVPFGLRGTIIGIHPEENPMNTMYDVMFDQEFPSGIAIRGSAKRCYIVPAFAMLNLKCSAQQKHPHQQQQQQQPLTPQWKISSQPFQCQQYQQGQGQNSYTSLLNARDERFTHTSLLNPRDERFTHTPLHQRDERFTPGRKSMWTKKPDPQPAYNNHDFCPQFVMPKFASSSPSASRKTSASVPNLPADDSDFTNIWNQLRKSNTTAGTNNRQIPQHYAGHRTDIGNQKMPGNKKDTRSIESPVFDIASLQVAAEKLGKISPPSGDLMEVKHPDNPPTGILVDLSDSNTVESAAVGESTTWSFGAHTASSSVQEHNVGTTDVSIDAIVKQSQTKTQVTQSSHNQKKPSVLALFESASRARETHSNSLSQSEQSNPVHVAYSQQQTLTPMVTDPVKATGDISAHLAALHIPKCTSPSTLVTGTQPTAALQESAGLQSATLPQRSQEDGSAALKQMLKIGLEEAASVEPINKKFYGKQVSVQELFDVAKQAPPLPKVETKSEAKPVQQPQQLQQHTQQHLHQQPPQQQQYLQRPAVKVVPGLLPFRPLMNMSGMQGRSKVRNHVEELAELCQASGLLQPKYDFNYQRQRGFTSLVTLPSGARFEGSLSSSQEEAAESAAGMALLCLQQTQVRFAGGFGAPWLQQPGFGMGVLHPRQRLTSPNSAFSPVTNPLMIFSQPPPNLPGQRARQPLISCPPPVIPNSSCQLPSSSRAPAPFSHFTQPSSSQSQSAYSDPNSHSATSEAWQRLSHQNTPDHEHEKGKDHQLPTRSSTEAFIPLQVTVKQRRREELSEQHPVTLSTVTNNSQNKMTASCSPREEKVSTCDLQVTDSKGSMKSYCQAVICSDATISTATCNSSQSGVNERKLASACKEDETATDRDHASAGSGKKRRSRIVANFGADSSK